MRDEALRSAAPTHAHADGAAGAVAVAIAAALAQVQTPRAALIAEAVRWTPESLNRDGLRRADELGLAFDVQLAGEELGTGAKITSQDTVPFAVWVAARHLASYEDALWTATSHPGPDHASNGFSLFAIDRDTVRRDRRRHRRVRDRPRRHSAAAARGHRADVTDADECDTVPWYRRGVAGTLVRPIGFAGSHVASFARAIAALYACAHLLRCHWRRRIVGGDGALGDERSAARGADGEAPEVCRGSFLLSRVRPAAADPRASPAPR